MAGWEFSVPRRLGTARGVIGPVAHQHCIEPYPFLDRVEPLVLKSFLTDWANSVNAATWIWHEDVLWSLCILGGLGSLFFGRHVVDRVDGFAGFEPVLDSRLD